MLECVQEDSKPQKRVDTKRGRLKRASALGAAGGWQVVGGSAVEKDGKVNTNPKRSCLKTAANYVKADTAAGTERMQPRLPTRLVCEIV